MRFDVGVTVAIVVFAVLLGWWMIAGMIAEQHEWEHYAKDHHCQKAGDISGTVSTGIDMNGKTTVITTPSKTIYRCDGGETKIR